ncbi:DUF4190 domain-containing protein [Microterricola viridarii]|uniref:DUF4190 domain-containing protein n=1 Tax=Microterricola viridarii TaxID=412690 RepID=A0A120I0T8_9MICO|nr:DUF4190 domain-containing protein [Microterricola viridarii]AMB57709.1 hypothetical protein AWU67_01225 [Microterricola viridarii]
MTVRLHKARTADQKGSTMTDQNQPPVPPNEPTPPVNPDFTAPEAPAAPPVPPAPNYGAPQAPPAPPYGAPAVPPAPQYAAPAAPQYGAPQYGAPANYGQPGGAPKTNTFAIVSLVASVVGFFTGITFLVGIIFGHIALSQIKKSGENGRGMAIAGLVIGYIGLVLGIILTIALIAIFTTVAVNSPGYSY